MILTGIQMLRLVAAMLVAVMHITQALSVHLTGQGHSHYWAAGSAGVDIFFVISGFVMGITTPAAAASWGERAQQAWHFLKRRLIRVLPLYWFYTLLKVTLLAAVPAVATRFSLDAAHLGASLLFVPWLSPWGEVQPVLPVGWTLNFEMLFYAVFALAMLLGAPRLGLCLAVFWLLMGLAQWGSTSTAVNFWGSSITLEFVAGVGLARLHALQKHWSWQRIPPEAGLLATCLGLVLMFGLPWSADDSRFLSWGMAATLMVAGVLWMEPWLQQLRTTKALKTPH
jgi:exopolysaccharide production protein ExoZ